MEAKYHQDEGLTVMDEESWVDDVVTEDHRKKDFGWTVVET